MQEDPQDGYCAQNVSAGDHGALGDQNIVMTMILYDGIGNWIAPWADEVEDAESSGVVEKVIEAFGNDSQG